MKLSFLPFLCTATVAVNAQMSPPSQDHDDGQHTVALENVVITAAPFERDQTRLAAATTVLRGEQLSHRLQPSLGETLSALPGVSSTYFGPGASRPVIRGLEGDRLRILSNGVGTIDASVISPDHAVSLDPLLIERVEIVRGPAALLYGGNAIGGVVNVMDHRIHHRSMDRALTARAESRYSSVDDGWAHAALVEGSVGAVAWHVDGYRRKTDDVDIPGYAFSSGKLREEMEERIEHGEPLDFAHGTLPNSSTETDGAAAGLSVSGSRGFLGVSFSGHNAFYGVPPGAHVHHEHEHDDDGEAGADHEEHHDHAEEEFEENVRIDLRQRRVDVQGELTDPLPGFEKAKLKIGLARYRHVEVEGSEIATTFQNRGFDSRLELVQLPAGRLNGAVGLQLARNTFSAEGEEAFLPASKTRTAGAFAFEEYETDALTYQFGGRVDRQSISLPDTARSAHRGSAFSVSTGAIWKLAPDWTLSGTLARNERQPNVQELFADGPHAGTSAYEIGNETLDAEESVSAELVLRRHAGRITGEVSLFAHRFSGYIFPEATGERDPEHGLETFRYVQRDADFYGAEAELLVHLHESRTHSLDLRFTADTVRAKQRDAGTSLPRITPRRASAGIDYRSGGFSAGFGVLGVERARKLAPNETPTPGYVTLYANLRYSFQHGSAAWSVFASGQNLGDETARNHASFLKEIAPLPGRNITGGIQVAF